MLAVVRIQQQRDKVWKVLDSVPGTEWGLNKERYDYKYKQLFSKIYTLLKHRIIALRKINNSRFLKS